MVNKKMKKVWLILTLCLTLIFGSSINAYAYVDESATTEATTEAAVTVEEELSADTESETDEEPTEETENSGAFSEAGNLSLLDDVGSDSAKELEYMTVQTKSGAVFYLVIDRSTDTENVYFLNQVDAADLMAIMDDAEKQEYENSLQEEVTEVPDTPVEEEPVVEEEPAEEEKTDLQTNNLALFGVIGVIAVVVIGGYAFMKKKAKKDGADLEEDLEFYDDEEYENEDEVEDQEIEFVDLEEEEK